MALLVGALLAFSVGLMGTASGLDRDRAFYSTVAMVESSWLRPCSVSERRFGWS
jgi:hypothetical protein